MPVIDSSKAYVKYAYDVINKIIPASVHNINACRRFINDFNRDDLEFNYKKVDRVIQFVEILKHHDAPPGIVNTPIILSDWQKFIVANIFGWEYKATGIRRFSRSYICVARKNAKTQLMAALGMFSLFEYRSANQILLTANTREQSGRLLDFCKAYAKQLDPAGKSLKIKRDRIEFKDTGGYVLILSSDYKSADGYNPYWACVDELHESGSADGEGSRGVDVLKSGMVKPGAHLSMITTAGFDTQSFCYQFQNIVADVLAGVKQDDRLFGMIFQIDSDDLYTDKNCWIKASPNIGKSAPWEFYEDGLAGALNSPTDERNFLVKQLNVWQQTNEVWIPDGYIRDVMQPVDIKKIGDDEFTYLGIDLSAFSDMTAVSYAWWKESEEKYYFYTDYYLPEACLLEGQNAEFYRRMKKENWLKITSGNVVDYEYILKDILTKKEKFGLIIKKIGYDSWNAYSFVIQSINAGLKQSLWEPVSQSIGNFNRGTKEMEKIILAKECVIDANPITQWMFQNCVIKCDHNGNIKPTKAITGKGSDIKWRKIDGIISMIESLMITMQFGRKLIYMPGSEDSSNNKS